MKIIESAQNELIKRYAKLSQKKFRDEEKLYVIEGNKNAYDSLNNLSINEIEAVLVRREEAEHFICSFPKLEPKIISADKNILKKISDYASEAEIIVVAKQRNYNKEIDSSLCVYLDRIRDPGNLGTIIRTAAAAGFGIILDNCCDLFSPKVIRGCMSAITSAQIYYGNISTINKYKGSGYKIVGADATGKNIFDVEKSTNKGLVIIAIGNEAEGLSREILLICDEIAAIPMENIESLNAAVAAGILMFEYKYRIELES